MQSKKTRKEMKVIEERSANKEKFQPYEEYWNEEELDRGLDQGQIIKGLITINPKNSEEAFVFHPDGKSKVFINSMHDRNRALNGDVVYLLILPKDSWKVSIKYLNSMEDDLVATFKKFSIHQSRRGNGNKEKIKRGTSAAKAGRGKKTEKDGKTSKYVTMKDLSTPGDNELVSPVIKRLFVDTDVYQSENGEILRLEQKINILPANLVMRTGVVVGIAELKHNRACIGRLKLQPKKNPIKALLSPLDQCMPRISIPISDCPNTLSQRSTDFKNTLFIAEIQCWESSSKIPFGKLTRCLGELSEIELETEKILMEYEIDSRAFSADVLSCLPKVLPWKIPPEEFASRRDLTELCVFTIDPNTARDLDDSLSCESIGGGLYEVGVHIADVSYFVKPETSLDEIAACRSTSVYLVQKVIPMLPELLCEQLCSLLPAEDRLTFSVIWKMNENGEIVDEWFGRTIVRSCAKLTYNDAQGFIDRPEKKWSPEDLPNIFGGFTISMIRNKVLDLNKIAVNLRKKRSDNGALIRLNQNKLQFKLDEETGMPKACSVYQMKDSNHLVEEFMLLANMAVAQKIKESFPTAAVMRCHPPPHVQKIDGLVALFGNIGIPIDTSSSGKLQRSILSQSATGNEDAASRTRILLELCARTMQSARYFCAGKLSDKTEWHHYALNVPLYTHFTSPIRRYPDIMVHRLLAASLGYDDGNPEMTIDVTDKLCRNSNDRKWTSKRVQEMSSDLFFGVFVNEYGPVEENGRVMSVFDKGFDVLVLKTGFVKTVYCSKMPLAGYTFDEVRKPPRLQLVWSADEQHVRQVKQTISIFTPVSCRIVSQGNPLKWNLEINHPEDS